MDGFEKEPDYFEFDRGDLLALLPTVQGKYLEIGCGAGKTLEILKAKGATFVAGVDLNAEAIGRAKRRNIDFALCLDVEREPLPFGAEHFDGLILADVLEHLYDPWSTLTKCVHYLRPGGYVLISIPNIKHYAILLDLILRDRWRYEQSGILDRNHLRFFTLSETLKLLQERNLKILRRTANYSTGPRIRFLNRLVANRMDTFMVYQYHLLAQKC